LFTTRKYCCKIQEKRIETKKEKTNSMANISIVMAGPDERCFKKLNKYFTEKTKNFDVCYFTSKEGLAEYISDKKNKADIILLAEEFSDVGIKKAGACVIMLTDGETTVNRNQRTDRLVKSLLKVYAEKAGRIVVIAP